MSDDDEHDDLVVALQDVMLPAGIPVLPGVDLGARYCIPSSADEAVGNWFDVITLSGGRLAMVVGEAVGSGMATAAAMGQVRAVLRAGLERSEDVVAALELADVFAATSEDARGTAVVVAVLDPAARTLVHATAGHPAPVVAGHDGGAVRLLEPSPAGWLGTGTAFSSVQTPLERGDLVLLACTAAHLSTASVSTAIGRVRRDGDVEGTCDRLMDSLFSVGGKSLTLLGAELRLAWREPFDLELAAADLAKRTARERLTSWLDEIDTPPMDAMAIIHATAELVANAVEHAHSGHHGTAVQEASQPPVLEIRGELTPDGEVHIGVTDHGSWREPSDDDHSRGRGLAMAAGLVDSLRISTGEHGTRAELCQRLSRPVHIDQSPASPTTLPTRAVEVTRSEPGEVSLEGSFGHDDVDRVTAELLLASRGGTRPVRVQLGQLTRVTSAAVRMLGDLVAHDAAAPIVLSAPRDSLAQRALDVARVPHDES